MKKRIMNFLIILLSVLVIAGMGGEALAGQTNKGRLPSKKIYSVKRFADKTKKAKKAKKPKKKKKIYLKNAKLFVTYRRIGVGETRRIRVANSKASIKVILTPNNVYDKGVNVTSSNPNIIRVKKINNTTYDFTGVSSGSATLTIKTRGKTKSKKHNVLKTRIVVNKSISVRDFRGKLIAPTRIELNFNSYAGDVKMSDISVLDSNGNNIPVLSMKLKEDEKTIVLDLGASLLTGQDYKVKLPFYTAYISGADVNASRIELGKKNIRPNEENSLDIKLFNNDGMDVTSFIKDIDSLKVSLVDKNGVVRLSGSGINTKVFMLENSTAKISITYKGITKEESLSASYKKDASLESIYKTTIAYNKEAPNFDLVNKEQPAIYNVGQPNPSLAILLKTDDGQYICNKRNSNYYSEKAVWKYEVKKNSGIKIDSDGALTIKKAGYYMVNISLNYNGENYKYLATIKAVNQKFSNLVISPSSLTVSKVDSDRIVRLSVYDSNNNLVQPSRIKDISIKYNGNNGNSKNPQGEPDYLKNLVSKNENNILELKINASGLVDPMTKAGSYTYIVTATLDKNNSVYNFLTVKVVDSTSDQANAGYSFKYIANKNVDITIRPSMTTEDVKSLAKGIDMGVYGYNQFGTNLMPANAFNYKVNGVPLINNQGFEASGSGYKLMPIAYETDANNNLVIKKLLGKGNYIVESEYYDNKGNKKHIVTQFTIVDDQSEPVDGKDYLVKRNGINGAGLIITDSMPRNVNALLGQIVTNVDGSRFDSPVYGYANELGKPQNEMSQYLVPNKQYMITKAFIPTDVVSLNGEIMHVYVGVNLNLFINK